MVLCRRTAGFESLDVLVQGFDFPGEVDPHTPGPVGDLVSIASDGFCPRLDMFQMVQLFFNSSGAEFDSGDGLFRFDGLMTLANHERAGDAKGSLD